MAAPKSRFAKQVEEVLETFDFERVHRVMESLAWTWANLDRVPTRAELVAEARRLLQELDGSPGVHGSGGLRASYKEKQQGGANPIMDSELVERLGRRFKTRDTGPVSAFHTELLEQLTQKTVIEDAALIKLAQARGQAMREDLVKNGLDGGRVSVAAAMEQAAKDKQVGSKMVLGAAKVPAATSPAAATP